MAQTYEINLKHLPSITNPVYYPLYTKKNRYLILYGGAGSGKSRFCAQKICVRIMVDAAKCLRPHKFLVIRKVARTLRKSCWAEFKTVIYENGWQHVFTFNKSDMTITFVPTGSEIHFVGCDDVEKLKSIHGITSIWIEEATELSEDDWEQIDLRIRGRSPFYKQFMLSFNPINSLHWLKKRFFDTPQGDRTYILKTTFRDNRYLDDEDIAKMEHLREQNAALFRVYGEGDWGLLEGLIFKPPRIVKAMPAIYNDRCYGMDFGFRNPTTLTDIRFGEVDRSGPGEGDVFLDELLYESGLTTQEIHARMVGLRVDPNVPIYADSEDPGRIFELQQYGWNIKPANKGPGSVKRGIALMQNLNIHVTESSQNLITEFSTYMWREDASGNPIDGQPVKFNDHGLDGSRYGIDSHLRPQGDFEQIIYGNEGYGVLDSILPDF